MKIIFTDNLPLLSALTQAAFHPHLLPFIQLVVIHTMNEILRFLLGPNLFPIVQDTALTFSLGSPLPAAICTIWSENGAYGRIDQFKPIQVLWFNFRGNNRGGLVRGLAGRCKMDLLPAALQSLITIRFLLFYYGFFFFHLLFLNQTVVAPFPSSFQLRHHSKC